MSADKTQSIWILGSRCISPVWKVYVNFEIFILKSLDVFYPVILNHQCNYVSVGSVNQDRRMKLEDRIFYVWYQVL
jgi:hypothetical protein